MPKLYVQYFFHNLSLRKHCSKEHGRPSGGGRVGWILFDPASVTEARYHRCRHPGCPVAVFCDRSNIVLHLRRAHGGQTLIDYCKMEMPATTPSMK